MKPCLLSVGLGAVETGSELGAVEILYALNIAIHIYKSQWLKQQQI